MQVRSIKQQPLLLLFFISSAFAGQICQGNAAGLEDAQRTELLKYHNDLRESIAKGQASNNEGLLPSAKNMYKLKYDCKMEKVLFEQLKKCEGRVTFTNGYGQNIAVIQEAFIADKNNRLKMALDIWHSPVKYYGLKSSGNRYNDARLYTFANMVYAKTLRIGCAYKDGCNHNNVVKTHVSCIYNLVGGFPNNVLWEEGTGCKTEGDCKTYPGSLCVKAEGLCRYQGQPPVPGGEENKMCSANKGMSDSTRKMVLEAHNTKRSLLARGKVRNGQNPKGNLSTSSYMPAMVYDCDVEASAIQYASTCPSAKSPEGSRNGYGENFYVYPEPNADPTEAFKEATESWWNQINADSINGGLRYQDSLNEKKIDQTAFTQMAWAKSVKLGCAIQTCSLTSVVICRYSPPGNILNEVIYTKGGVCGGCIAACDRSVGLCNFYNRL
ncbi:hypothetical protein RB195_016328 [Necator americanus]